MRLFHRVLPGKRQHHVAICADDLTCVAVKHQVVGIGQGPSGARHARHVVCFRQEKRELTSAAQVKSMSLVNRYAFNLSS